MPIINPMLPLRRGSWLSVLLVMVFAVAACKGDTGEPGAEGPAGPEGPPGETPGPEIEPEILGLVGRIIEPNLVPVPSGTVYLVPAADVETLSETPIDLFLSPEDTEMLAIDEPIEDLLDDNGDSYEQAEVDSSGTYRFETLPEGSYFVVWAPAADDAEHLPGGDSSSVSFDTASLVGMQLDIRVSSQPGSSATYVGSSTCMVCHGLHSTTRTAHNVGLQVPGVRSVLQDVEPWPNFDDGLAAFDTNTTTLFYYDCDPGAANPSKCKVDAQDPGAGVSFEVRLRRDAGVLHHVVGDHLSDQDAQDQEHEEEVQQLERQVGERQLHLDDAEEGQPREQGRHDVEADCDQVVPLHALATVPPSCDPLGLALPDVITIECSRRPPGRRGHALRVACRIPTREAGARIAGRRPDRGFGVVWRSGDGSGDGVALPATLKR